MLIVDGHVHIHSGYDLSRFLDAAFDNLRAEALEHGRGGDFTGLLVLTEAAGADWFLKLFGMAENRLEISSCTGGNWRLRHTREDVSLQVSRPGGQGFFLIAGRQLVTREALEVLAFPGTSFSREGDSLENMIYGINCDGCIAVVPWGFGKWLGHRGKVLTECLAKAGGSLQFFLGDNGGRVGCWPPPRQFQAARERRLRIIPGSDPFPFAWEVGRAGSYGFWSDTSVSWDFPARDLKQLLLEPQTSIWAYGQLERPLRFIRNQLAMQIAKKRNSQ